MNNFEHKYCSERFQKIEQQRQTANQQEKQINIEHDMDTLHQHNSKIPEPIPNQNHTYCQICCKNYDDFLEHLANDTHKTIASV